MRNNQGVGAAADVASALFALTAAHTIALPGFDLGGWLGWKEFLVKLLRRALKWFAFCVLAVLAVPVFGLLGIWGWYSSIVRETPGTLEVAVAPGPLGAHVNPFCGTGGVPWMCAHNTPAATTPFGMVRLGPDTASILANLTGTNRSGYYFGDNKIIGFSHTRLVGADAQEGGVFRVFPTVASRVTSLIPHEDRFARFSHRDETAFPGYYAVRLPKDEVLVELTATPRAGAHRYTFTKDEMPHLLLEVTSAIGDKHCEAGRVRVLADTREIEGSVRTFGSFSGRYGGLDVYFVARFDRPFASHAVLSNEAVLRDWSDGQGDNLGVDLNFDKGPDALVVEVRVGISYVSVANARLNLDTETAGRSFEDIAAAARDAWEQRLALVRVEGGTETQRRIFNTALYRAFQMPTVFTDVNGEYLGFDRAVHKAVDFQYYTDFSLWDTFRTVQPLYNVIARADQRDMMRSLLDMAQRGGTFPRWPSGCGYTGCMFGTPADMAVSEAYLKGVRDFDIEAAYAIMRRTALEGRPEGSRGDDREGLEWYKQFGYCPSDKMGDSVSATLEYAWADHSLALLAKELGHTADMEMLERHAQSYRNLWNPETLFFMPRDSQGRFATDFKPLLLSYLDFDRKYTRAYVEGSAMQWRWGVPFDAEGLISLFPNREQFVSELEAYMGGCKTKVGPWNPGGNYWHGNEPYIHAAYLFNAAGRPDLTQKWVRWILEHKYSDDYVGLDGNDDGGTLSSWYVFSALGFYPIAGTTRYELGSPIFEKAVVQIGDNTLTVTTENSGPENIYVQRVWLNDTALARTWFTHDAIANGGTLRFEMAATPGAD